MKNDKTPLTPSDLDGFTGTEGYHKLTYLKGLVCTDGVKYLAEHAGGGCFWLVDAVASHLPQVLKNAKLREFQLWRLERTPNTEHGVTLTCRGDTHDKPVVTQVIEYSDFPAELMPFEWYVGPGPDGKYMVMLLKSEY
jgi:hypothetical protein